MLKRDHVQISPTQRLDILKDEMQKLLVLSSDERVDFKTVRDIVRRYTNKGVGYCFDRLLYYYIYHVSVDDVENSVFCSVMDKYFLFNGIRGAMNIMSVFDDGDHIEVVVQLFIASIISAALLELPAQVNKDFFINGVMTDGQFKNTIDTIGKHRNFLDLIEMIENNMDIPDNPTIENYILSVNASLNYLYYSNIDIENNEFHDTTRKYIDAVSRYLKPRIKIADKSLNGAMDRLTIDISQDSLLLSDILKNYDNMGISTSTSSGRNLRRNRRRSEKSKRIV